MFDFLSKLFGRQKSGGVAKERLQLVLIHDRNDIAPDVLENIKVEIISALKKYLEIDENEIDMHLDKQNRSVALVANIPLKHIKRGRGKEPLDVKETAVTPKASASSRPAAVPVKEAAVVAQEAPISDSPADAVDKEATAGARKTQVKAKTDDSKTKESGSRKASSGAKEAAGHARKNKTPKGQKKKNA